MKGKGSRRDGIMPSEVLPKNGPDKSAPNAQVKCVVTYMTPLDNKIEMRGELYRFTCSQE